MSLGVGLSVIAVTMVLFAYADLWFMPVFLVGIAAIVVWIQQGQLVGGAVKVSPNQFPEINAIAETAANRLSMSKPEVFIKYDPSINAFAIGFLSEKSVVLHSALVEAMRPDELQQIIGHEFSHIKCGHTNLSVLASPAEGINVPVISQVLSFVFLLWSRKAEYTCDRGGLLVSRDPRAAISAMCKLAVGPELFKNMDVDGFLNQQLDLDQNGVAKLSEIFVDHPYLVRRIHAIRQFYASQEYRALTARAS